MKVWLDQTEKRIYLVNDKEHQTLHCPEDTPLDDMILCVGIMQAKDFDEAFEVLRVFHQLHGGCIMGDLKPGLLWEWNEEEDLRDIWKDRVSWDRWISEEYIAQEYYVREQRRRSKK